MHNNPRTYRRFGFTMTELMVSITIVTILATIAFMGAKKVMQKAAMARGMNNMRQLGLGLMGYHEDLRRYPGRNDGLAWDRAIIPYLGHSTQKNLKGNSPLGIRRWPELEQLAGLFHGPNDKFDRNSARFPRSYAIVPWTTNWSNGTSFRGWKSRPFNQGVPLTIVRNPSMAAVLVEWHEGTEGISNDLGSGNHAYHDMGGPVRDKSSLHQGRQIVLFADGHADLLPFISNSEFVRKYWPGSIGNIE